MSEIEAGGLDSIGALFRRPKPKHALPLGTPCPNCGTPLAGPWCHACGQQGEEFHRSALRLVGESVEGLLHFDGRFWTTVPGLLLHPARLTRAYLDGHRAPQIPPLRLFLVVLLLVFLAGSVGGVKVASVNISSDTTTNGKLVSSTKTTRTLQDLSPEERSKVDAALSKGKVEIMGREDPKASAWLRERAHAVLSDPERFYLVMEQWAERFAFLMLPIAAGLLSLLFLFQRRFFIFDHTIFALHSLSATGLVLTVVFLLSKVSMGFSNLMLWTLPVHLFVHMRGVYRTSVPGTLIRMALLFTGSMVGFAFIMGGLIWVGLSAMGHA